eukprot:1189771-Prorocentrum_minimum.AAC.4
MIEDKEENISKEVTRTKDLEKQQYILMHKVRRTATDAGARCSRHSARLRRMFLALPGGDPRVANRGGEGSIFLMWEPITGGVAGDGGGCFGHCQAVILAWPIAGRKGAYS